MLISYVRGQGSIILRVKILNSSVATGAGLTGLTFSSTGMIISTIADNESSATAYTVAGSTIETITTLGTFAAPTATKCRFKEVDATNHKGVYEIQIADARYAVSSAKSILVSVSGATNAAETDAVIPLTDHNPYDVVRGGMTALPNAAASAVGGLPVAVDTSGRVDVLKINGTSQTARDIGASVLVGDKTGFSLSAAAVQAIWDALTSALTTVGSIGKLIVTNLDAAISSRSTYSGGDTSGTTTLLSRIGAALTITGGKVDVNDKTGFSLSAAAVQAIWDALTSALTTVGSIGKLIVTNLDAAISSRSTYGGGDTSGTTTLLSRIPGTVQPQTGDAFARLGAPAGASVSADVATIAGYVDTEVAAIKAKTDNLPASPASVTDVRTQVDAALDAAGSELSAIPGATGTLRQKLTAVYQYLMFKRSTTATTETMYKADGSTSLGTSTVSDDSTTAVHGKVA